MTVRYKSLELDKLTVTIPQEVLFQDLGEETVLLNVATGKYHGLNGVGSRIWELIQESNPMEMVLATLLDEFEVSSKTLEDDLSQFLGVLQSKGLIEIHEADGQ
ncbi:MAG: PqqD family protein [Chloroflexi bacterium]|nr:PqqD family protein [Chloroflexota bacterium]MCH8896689.1 PqqD family protein [Chloroflexota bacterium]